MIKKVLKRSLSIFLTLVLIATTFFIFDPSVLKMDASAVVNVETNTLGSSLAAQTANAPETIYLKPGSANFQYYSLINPENGTAGNSKSETGAVTFNNGDAASVKLYVNNFWVKKTPGGSFVADDTGTVLTLNGTRVATMSGVSPTNLNVAGGATIVASGTKGFTFTFNSGTCALANYTEGYVYMIEWCVHYVTGSGSTAQNHYMFMYTGIYAPRLTITGSVGHGVYTGFGNTPEAMTFAFITGAMGYYAGGNYNSNYTTKTWSGTSADNGNRAAPLVGFKGQKSADGSPYTIPDTGGGENLATHMATELTAASGNSGYVQLNGRVNTETPRFSTYYTSIGNYLDMTVQGTNCSDCASGAGFSGVAYEVVDTSRFTNYSQIPNLSAGLVRYYAVNGGYHAQLDKITSVKGTSGDFTGTPSIAISCAVDRSDYDDDEANRTRTWGLYPFNGVPATGNVTMLFEYHQSINLGAGHRTVKIQHGVGFSTLTVNKDAIRKAYCTGLVSNIDNILDSGFSDYYNKMKTQAMKLCDPTETTNTLSISETDVKSKQNTIIANNVAKVCTFYVPEVIYLDPSDQKTFEYYVDRANSVDGALRTGENTTGNVYFNAPGATNVTISYTGVSSMTLGATSANAATLSTSITSGSLASALADNATSTIEWTAKYTIDGIQYQAKAYSTVYSPFVGTSSVAAAMCCSSFKCTWHSDPHSTGTLWLTGGHSIGTSGAKVDWSSGKPSTSWYSFYGNPLKSSTVITGGTTTDDKSTYPSNMVSGSGLYATRNDSDPDGDHCDIYGGTLNITVDTSRYNDYSQIPNLKIGMDINYVYKADRTEGNNAFQWHSDHADGSMDNNNLTGSYVSTINPISQGSRESHHVEGSIKSSVTFKGRYGTNYSEHGSAYCRGREFVFLSTTTVDKSALRTAINNEVSVGRQMGWYTEASWNAYKTALKNAYTSLGDPRATDAAAKKTALDTAIAGLVKGTGELTATHVGTNGKTLGNETENYTFGDKTYAASNEYTGYTLTSAEHNFFDGADFIAAAGSTVGTNLGSVSWNAGSKTLTFTSSASGNTDNYTSNPRSDSYFIHVKPGTNYKMTYTASGASSRVIVFHEIDATPTNCSSWTNETTGTGEKTISGTTPADCYYLCVRFGNQAAGSTTTFTNIKLALESNSIPLTVTTDSDGNKAASETINNNIYKSSDYTFTYTPNTYDITYNPDGGTFNNTTETKTYEDIATYDASFNVGAVTNGGAAAAEPTRTGYTFDGWECSINGKIYKSGTDTGTVINPWQYDTDTVLFTAKWTPIKYNIEFLPNGGTGTMSPNPITNVAYDEGVTLPENRFTKDGYDFNGWKNSTTNETFADKAEVIGLSSTNGATVQLTAQWKAKTFDANAYAYSNTGAAPSTYANNTTGGTVQVDSQTAGASSTKSITYGNSYKVTATAKTGYYFVGWYNASSTTATGWAANPASTSAEWTRTMGNAATNAYARFDIEGYNITFNRNYDSNDQTAVKTLTGVKYGTTQTFTSTDLTRTGYVFGGWYETRACDTTQVYGTGTSITVKDHGNNGANVTLYAKWTANEITVTYAAGDGSGTAPGNHTFSYGGSVTPKANTFTPPAAKTVTFNGNGGSPTQDSANSTYSFVNWKSDKNSKTYVAGTAVSDSLGATGGTVTLTAQWTQSSVKLPNATRTGYTFDGWYTQSEGGDKVGGYNSDYTPGTSTILYAHWTVLAQKVNVYAYGNSIGTTGTWTSGAGGSVNVNNASAEESIEYSDSYTINATPATGYAFKGWYTASPANGTTWGTSESPNASYTTTMGANAVVYYARFDIVYCTVTAYAYSNNASALTMWANNATGGSVTVSGGTTGTTGTAGATSSGKVVTGTSATLTATPAAGYHFAGWYSSTNVSGSTSDTSATLTVPFTSEGATVNKYARFDINRNTLVVNPNNGTWNGSTETRTYEQVGGSTLSISNPTRTGYNFSAWTKNPTTLNGTLSGTTYTFPNNVFGQTDTITASWTPITYTIAFNKNNTAATGSMSNITGCQYDVEKTLPANGFTLTGYDFAGWKVGNAGDIIANGAKVKNLTDIDNNTVTLYAQWTIKDYTVTVVPYSNTADTPNAWTNSTVGGTVTGGGSKTYGGSYTIVATPATGYDFVAWYTTAPANGTGTEASTSASYTATMGAADITYYAKFSIKSFTVTTIAVADSAASTALSEPNATTAGCKAEPASSTVYYNENASLTATAGTGYTFAGWFTDADCTASAGTSATITPKITANKTYYAKFTVKKSTVSVVAYSNATGSYAPNTNGGTVTVEGVSPVIAADSSIEMGYNGSYMVTATPATGYTFDGWFTDTALTASAAVTATATFIKKDAEETLYAKFSLSASKLTLYAYNNTAADPNNYTNGTTGGTVAINNGTAAMTAEANINYGGTATITATPATGYTFDGWYSTVTGGLGSTVTAWGTQFTPTDSKSEAMTTARTYYAKFTIKSITVTFNPAGGSISSGSATATAYYNTALNAPVLTRPGYTLLGWSESQSATEATYPVSTISAEAVNTMVNAGTDKTLYAVWQEFNYTIFLAAASDTANAQGTYKIGTSGTTSGTSTGGTIAYKSGVTKINAGDTILDCFDVTPATGYELVDVIYKVTTSQPSANSDVTSNLTSSSWYSANNAGYKEMPEFENESSIVFIAYFKVRSFTATAYAYSNTTYDAAYRNTAAGGTVKVGQNGAPGATADESAFYGDSNGVTFYATANTGYTFDGWYKDAALTVQDDTATAASVKVVLGDDSTNANINKRYAKFSINTHTAFARAKYYTDGYDDATGAGNNGIKGGTVTVSSESGATATTTDINAKSIAVKYREEVTYTANPETGYEFVGWYVCTDTADTAYIEEDEAIETDEEYTIIMADADIRIHAKFVPINFVLTLNPNGVGAVNGPTAQVTLTYDRDVVLNSSAKPTRSSYKFIGWDETSSATEATYKHTGSNCTIGVDIVNRWFNESQSNGGVKVIYAVWETAKYIVTLDNQGGTGGESNVEAILDNPLPPLESLPTYEGYTFAGYFTEPGGDDKYYNADGTSAKNWDIANGATLYAKWVCPVLKDAIYDETADKWTYIYEDTTGADLEAAPTDEILTKQGISDNTPSGAKQITSVDEPKTEYVENKVKEAEDINLNHYTDTALDQLYKNVISTNTDLKRNKLSQIELNEYVANMARYLEINAPENKKTETVKPNVKLYETKNKVKSIKDDTLTKDLSVIGENYSKPNSNDAGTFVYTNKWSYFKEEAVDYYIYTNSRTPVIALEIDDGEVGTTVTNNNSSYPTNSVITADGNDEIVADKANSFMHSAIPATDDLNDAWFSTYTKANIGTRYDYNAKEIIYLTPSFTPDDPTSTTDEIVYTIKPSDNAVKENTGLQKAQIGQIPTEQADSFSSFKDSECPTDKESITVCICYHNAMNGTSDEGGVYGDPYFQMYINQLDEENAYMDTWLQQMRLFRQSGGASNWEIVLANESVYPVEDETYKDTKFVLGSFAYVFDSTNEPVAMSYAEAGDYDAAKNAIINSIKKTPSEKQAGILDKSHSEHLSVKGGVGLFALDYWSANFYPRQGSYVYVHLIDRWGNYFNKIWKCFKVDEYSAMISGKASTGFILNEDGGSNLATMTLECDDINLLTDVDSTFEDNIFITSGNTFVISTGKPKTKFVLSVVDHAGNELKGNIPTDADGNIKFTVEDPCADLSSGAYTFMLNDKEINLYAREPAVVRSASMTPVAFLGEKETVEIKTSADAIKVQLDENGATRTFTKDSPAVTVTENEDGTITWTIKISGLTCGEHEFGVNAKNSAGWHESNLTVKTLIVKEAIDYDKAIVSVSKVKINKGERVFAKVEVKKDTQAIRVKYDPDNYQTTVYRDNCNIQETEDGTEIWTVPAITFTKAGEYELNVYARCNNEWQTSLGESCFVTVGEKSVKDAVIYIVNVEKNELKLGEQTEITVITNSEATKIQLVYFGTTTTYTADNAEVTANEDGTITWVINRSFANIGTMDVVFKAKSSLGWIDGENFGTITITK